MTIFRRPLAEYIAFCKPFLFLILAVGLARLGLSLAGVPNSSTKWISMTAVVWIGVLYYSVRVHTSGFGSYKELLVICTLQNLTAQIIAIAGIVIGIATGTDNIYTAPEYAFGSDGKTWLHAGAHLLIGIPIGSLVGWTIGSLVHFTARKLVARSPQIKPLAH